MKFEKVGKEKIGLTDFFQFLQIYFMNSFIENPNRNNTIFKSYLYTERYLQNLISNKFELILMKKKCVYFIVIILFTKKKNLLL